MHCEHTTERIDGVGSEHRRQQPEEGPCQQERRPVGGGGEAAAVEAEVHVEAEACGAAEAGRGELRLRPAQLLPELRRRPCLLRPPPLVATFFCNRLSYLSSCSLLYRITRFFSVISYIYMCIYARLNVLFSSKIMMLYLFGCWKLGINIWSIFFIT